MLKIEKVSKTWGDFSLKDINLEIEDSEFFVVLGPSGAGKTLLLEVIAGIHFLEEGKISFKDKNITHLPPNKRNIGFVFQDAALFPNKKVWKNIIYGAKLRDRMNHSEAKNKASELLNLFDIEYITYRYPATLSGGEKQRVALARALIIEPDILLLDEPLASVDYNTLLRLKKEIKRIHQKFKTTTIYVTHNRSEAMSLADRIAVMNDGRIIQVGTPDQIFRKPNSEFVARFIGFDNIFEGRAEYLEDKGLSEININGDIIYSPDKLYGEVKVCIRPEDIVLSKEPLKSSMRNRIRGIVESIDDLGTFFDVRIDVGTHIKVLITQNALIDLDITLGTEIYLNFKAVALKTIK